MSSVVNFSISLNAPVGGYINLELRGFIVGSGLVGGLEKASTRLHLAPIRSCASVGNLHLRRAQFLGVKCQQQSSRGPESELSHTEFKT
jgi:hypothetical protein